MTSSAAPHGSPEIPRTLGDRLMKARKMAGLNVKQLHQKTGMARNSIPAYEADDTTPRAHTIMAYAMATHEAFGREPYEVFEWLTYGDSAHDLGPTDPSEAPVSGSRCNVAVASAATIHRLQAAA